MAARGWRDRGELSPLQLDVKTSAYKHQACGPIHRKCRMRFMDWNDLRFFLEVARAGTTLGASKTLRVSQSTVARRIWALEEALALELFDKLQSGYVLTDAGTDLRATAEEVEATVNRFKAKASANERGLAGTVKLTTNESFANYFLVKAMREFRNAYPSIKLEILTNDRRIDLSNGEADVAVRAGPRPTQGDLVGKRLAYDKWSLYCSHEYAEQHGYPRNIDELKAHGFISVDREMSGDELTNWINAHISEDMIVLRQSGVAGVANAIENGHGVSLMSDFLFDNNPKVMKCFTPEQLIPSEIWLITHERLRHVPRVRALMDFLDGYFAAGRHKL